MIIKTKYFGEVELPDDKVLHFENGLYSFEEYHDFVLISDNKDGKATVFSWLQSIESPDLAFPVIDPKLAVPEYSPVSSNDVSEIIGPCTDDELAVFVMATVPTDPYKSTINLKAPLIINATNFMGVQLIVDDDNYDIQHLLFPKKE